MNILQNVVWGLIPARGGSKSIPMKNLTRFGGHPLIDFQVIAARGYGGLARLLCSTDHPQIADRCNELDVEVHHRPDELGGDDTPIMAVIEALLSDLNAREGAVAECIALLQPTSPFLLAKHIKWTANALLANPKAGSAQTVVPCPHNHHAVNQRVIADGFVNFRYPEERALAHNKQKKAKHYLFGNLLIFRTLAAVEQQTPFASPSLPIEIPCAQGFDLDMPEDLKLGQALLASGLAELPIS